MGVVGIVEHRPHGQGTSAARTRRFIQFAMWCPDDLVVRLDYYDAAGTWTNRVVSPICWLGEDRFRALCLGREKPRQFYLDRCQNVQLVRASEVLMPEAIQEKAVPF